MHWFSFEIYDVELVIKARAREIKKLEKREKQLVRQGKVLQAAQRRRRIEHLTRLNEERRPRSGTPDSYRRVSPLW